VVRDCQDGTTREQCDAMEVGPVTTRFNGGPCAQADCVPRDCSQYQSSSCSLANLDAECLCNGVSPGSWWICVPDDGTPIRCGPL
jgi:hypothetical protein